MGRVITASSLWLTTHQVPTHDVVFALASVHWFRACTAHHKSVRNVVRLLASLARESLLVEWVPKEEQPAAGAPDEEIFLRNKLHVIPPDAYAGWTEEEFLHAMREDFSTVQLLEDLGGGRKLFFASAKLMQNPGSTQGF
ncbi:unnamed protein product [Amoebophrya sp. A25]|nr:unnamed protein product [Amoebophrya sp. A25]|eukprot:GSA25T00026514001.1